MVGVLAGCTPEDKPPAATEKAPAVKRSVDHTVLARGNDLYLQYCAACHGNRAQGAPNWQKPGPDGKYPPPPHAADAFTRIAPAVYAETHATDATTLKQRLDKLVESYFS